MKLKTKCLMAGGLILCAVLTVLAFTAAKMRLAALDTEHDIPSVTEIRGMSDYRTFDFRLQDNGGTIEYSYENSGGDCDATVRLYRQDFFRGWEHLSTLIVPIGGTQYDTYTESGFLRGTYYISVTAMTGTNVLGGTLSVEQVNGS